MTANLGSPLAQFYAACGSGNINIVRHLLVSVDPSRDSCYGIALASENGHLDIVELLIADPRVNPADYDNYAFRVACYNGHVHIAKHLLTNPRITPTAHDNGAILGAIANNQPSIISLLLDSSSVVMFLLGSKYDRYILQSLTPLELNLRLNNWHYAPLSDFLDTVVDDLNELPEDVITNIVFDYITGFRYQ